jgi:hypothetical protein
MKLIPSTSKPQLLLLITSIHNGTYLKALYMEQVGDRGARTTLREAVVQGLVTLRTVHPLLVRRTALGGRAAGKIRNPKASAFLHKGYMKM